ncbi:MAG: hypothetical protein K2N73_00775 [Lachnospiraceae bacterium]|nr:hypothetical protein [Lachnospiraceae bacterium]
MKKRVIELSKWHVVAFILLGLGMFLLLCGVFSWIKLRAALSISRLDTEDLRLGKYVKGEITQYAGRDIETIGGTAFNGVSASRAYGFTFYEVYTIPAADGKYVELLIDDGAIQDILKSYDQGVGSGAFFVGKAERTKYDRNYAFWDKSVTFGSAGEAEEKICDEYIIREIYPERIRYRMCAGLSLVLTASLIVRACGGVKIKV